jgi:UDP-galactopyranose mutase|tara:strand:- start:127 stop:1254 length:1128 start_codon:yes stop_codon:yes gene_type:complete
VIKTDYLIVGSGLYGSVLAERIANVLKKKVTIIEKRNHIGGNCYSEIDKKTGIEYHKYGTHIFHTSNETVWNYLSKFCELNSYRHQVLSKYKNKIYQLPINLETINSFFNKNFNPKEAHTFLERKTKKFKKKEYNNFEEKALSQIGKELYEAFIKGYTKKQWDKDPSKLPSTIFNRLPLRFNYNEDYFNNCKYQGIPEKGYTEIFKKLLNNKNITIHTNKKFYLNNNYKVKYSTIYTGPLDKLFNYKFGKLEWRSLRFKKEVFKTDDHQGTSVINFPEKKYQYTRIHEPRHLHDNRNYSKAKTLTIKEYPDSNFKEPYYPINTNLNRDMHRKYKTLVKNKKNFEIGGRLADYAYYDMDMTISAALKKFDLLKKIN